MSEPKRFDCLSDGMWQNSAGDYVLHSDYARLKADIESLFSAGEDLAHAVRTKHGVDFALEEWAKVANTEGGQP